MIEVLGHDYDIKEVWKPGFDTSHSVIDGEGDIHDLADYPNIELPDEYDFSELPEQESTEIPEKRQMVRAYPLSIEDNKRRINSNQIGHAALDIAIPRTDRELTAQEELGGGIDQTDEYQEHGVASHPLDEIIRESQPWQEEIYEAVERFGMNELTLAQYKAMSIYDRAKFAINFSRFYDLLEAQPRAIEMFEGRVENRPDILGKYGRNRTPDELYHYKETLENMLGILQATGIPEHAATDRETLINKARRQGSGRTAINNILRPNYHHYQFTKKTVK